MFHPLLFTYITSNSNISILPDFVTKCKTTKGDSVLKGDSDFPKVTGTVYNIILKNIILKN